jgi:hypothetical protein
MYQSKVLHANHSSSKPCYTYFLFCPDKKWTNEAKSLQKKQRFPSIQSLKACLES